MQDAFAVTFDATPSRRKVISWSLAQTLVLERRTGLDSSVGHPTAEPTLRNSLSARLSVHRYAIPRFESMPSK